MQLEILLEAFFKFPRDIGKFETIFKNRFSSLRGKKTFTNKKILNKFSAFPKKNLNRIQSSLTTTTKKVDELSTVDEKLQQTRWLQDEMTINEMTIDEMTINEMTIDKMTIDEMTIDEMNIDDLT